MMLIPIKRTPTRQMLVWNQYHGNEGSISFCHCWFISTSSDFSDWAYPPSELLKIIDDADR